VIQYQHQLDPADGRDAGYSAKRLGRIQSMRAFDAKSFETAIKDAEG
jgi:hypothetical protein